MRRPHMRRPQRLNERSPGPRPSPTRPFTVAGKSGAPPAGGPAPTTAPAASPPSALALRQGALRRAPRHRASALVAHRLPLHLPLAIIKEPKRCYPLRPLPLPTMTRTTTPSASTTPSTSLWSAALVQRPPRVRRQLHPLRRRAPWPTH